MATAQNIDGTYIGHRVRLYLRDDREVDTDELTMVLHKKNGNVCIRYGKNNRQMELKPTIKVWRMPHGSEV